MSREILFKAKRLDNGEWVEGFYVCLNGKQHRIYTGYAETDCEDYYPDWFEIDENTICQFTGLTDKNGKKIWENNVVKENGKLHKVVFYESMCSFVLVSSSGHWSHLEMDYGDKLECSDFEVIGNIFDNAELLEGGAEECID